jgi:hypothetical protein
MFEIDLEWPVASRYVFRRVRWPKQDVAIFPAEDATIVRRRPLEQNPSLYAEFARLDGSKKSCLEFAGRYGLILADLTYPGQDPGGLETLTMWRDHIQLVKDIIWRCELSRADPAEAFRQFGKKDEQVGGVELYLSNKSPKSPVSLDVRALSLIHAIELQAVQSILGGRRSISCIECSTWFEIGAGARRSLSKFCSTRCKDSYHNRLKALKGHEMPPSRPSDHVSTWKRSREK